MEEEPLCLDIAITWESVKEMAEMSLLKQPRLWYQLMWLGLDSNLVGLVLEVDST